MPFPHGDFLVVTLSLWGLFLRYERLDKREFWDDEVYQFDNMQKNRKDPIELPTALAKEIMPEGDLHIEEERRLFYVACTRARDHLLVTSVAPASEFLDDLRM